MFLTIYLYCCFIWYHLFVDHWQVLRSCLKWRKEWNDIPHSKGLACLLYLSVCSFFTQYELKWEDFCWWSWGPAPDFSHSCEAGTPWPLVRSTGTWQWYTSTSDRSEPSDRPHLLRFGLHQSGFSARNLNSRPRNLNTKMSVQCALSAKKHSVLRIRVLNSKDCKTKHRSQVESTTGPVASHYVLTRAWLMTVDLGIQMKDSIIIKAHVDRQSLAYLTKHLENRRLEE